MKTQFDTYYQSEKQNAWMRILAGGVSIIGALVIYYLYPMELLLGIALSIAPISLYQIGRGLKKLRRARLRINAIKTDWVSDKKQFIQSEVSYLQNRLPKYKFHRNVEVFFVGTGIILMLLGSLGGLGLFMLGTGMGLAIQGAIALYLELIAEWYAGLFLKKIKKN